MRKITNEEFMEKLAKRNDKVTALDEYITATTKIRFQCKKCKNIWSAIPNSILNGRACPKCGQERQNKTLRKTNEEFVQEMKEKFPNIIPKEEYVNGKTKILFQCKTCNHEWKALPSNILGGRNCPKCSKENAKKMLKKTHEQFLAELQETNPNIEALGIYENSHAKMDFRCKKCNYVWNTEVASILFMEHGCPDCARKKNAQKRRSTHEEFVKKLEKINPNIKPLDEYVNATTKIRFQCKKCKNIWSASPNSALSGHGCPECVAYSRGNELLENILKKYNLYHKSEIMFSELGTKRFDNSVLNENGEVKFLFEYDGRQHFRKQVLYDGENGEGFIKRTENDNLKNKFCSENNIPLLRIPYTYDPLKDSELIEKIILNFLENATIPEKILNFYAKYDFSNYVNCVMQEKVPA